MSSAPAQFFQQLYYTETLTYSDAFAWEFSLTSLIWGLSALILAFLLNRLSRLIKAKTIKNHSITASEKLLQENVNQDSVGEADLYVPKRSSKKYGAGYRFSQGLYVIAELLHWFALFCLAMAPVVLSSLGVISIAICILIDLFIAVLKYINLVYTHCPSYDKSANKFVRNTLCSCAVRFFKRAVATTKLYKWRFSAFIAVSVAFSVAAPLLTADSCINHFNDGYGFMFQGYRMSTKVTRYFELDTACPDGKICQMYATLAENAAKSVFITVHTGTDITGVTVKFDTLANYQELGLLENNATVASYYIGLEAIGDRYVHTAYLTNLNATTMYYFEVENNGEFLGNGTYQTLPSEDMERNILMVAGGDVGNTPTARQMTETVGSLNPDVVLIGGDLAYDNGIRSCYYSYDFFLRMINGMNTQAGRLVPLMISVGNHDLGTNAFQNAPIDITTSLFYIYFPRHSAMNSQGELINQVPDLADRLSYSYHQVGNMVQLSLDSGYMTDYDGAQQQFLNSTVQEYKGLWKVANYHVPMYPVCEQEQNDPRTYSHPQQYWAGIFETEKFAAIYENHAHLYKKTYPMIGGVPNPGGDGVVYFGDGNWGTTPNPCFPNQFNQSRADIFEKKAQTNNVWIVDLTSTTLTYYAIDQTGKQIDANVTLNIQDYVTN